jgi:hypothetical protein
MTMECSAYFRAILACLSLIVLAGQARAHHSFYGTFDTGKKTEATGVVTEFHFFNPHVSVYFDVTNSDGTIARWMSEGNAASNYTRLGWTPATLKKGDVVRISGDATRDGSPMVTLGKLELLDGRDRSVARVLTEPQHGTQPVVAQRGAAQSLSPRLSDGRPNLSGTWTEADHQRFPGPAVPYNDAGRALQASARIADDPQIFCEPPGLVRQVASTPHAIRITQQADRVVIDYEEYGGRREIPLVAKGVAPAASGKSRLGTAVAHYDGDALVIETTGLLGSWISPHGDQFSDQTTTIETYRRSDDPQSGPMLSMAFVANDPAYLRSAFTFNKARRYAGDYQFIPNECRAPLRSRNSN